jgi:hypothetical protein
MGEESLRQTFEVQTNPTSPSVVTPWTPPVATFVAKIRVLGTLAVPGAAGGTAGDSLTATFHVQGSLTGGVLSTYITPELAPFASAPSLGGGNASIAVGNAGGALAIRTIGNNPGTPAAGAPTINWTVFVDVDSDL